MQLVTSVLPPFFLASPLHPLLSLANLCRLFSFSPEHETTPGLEACSSSPASSTSVGAPHTQHLRPITWSCWSTSARTLPRSRMLTWTLTRTGWVGLSFAFSRRLLKVSPRSVFCFCVCRHCDEWSVGGDGHGAPRVPPVLLWPCRAFFAAQGFELNRHQVQPKSNQGSSRTGLGAVAEGSVWDV